MDVSLIKRAVLATSGHDPSDYKLPQWTWIVLALDLIILLPVCVIFNYTLKNVYPVFAIIEDETPPAYEPVALHEGDDAGRPASSIIKSDSAAGAGARYGGGGDTGSLRGINRLLMAHGGVTANLRGLSCYLAQSAMTTALVAVFDSALGGLFTPVATLLAALALVQFSAAWVHVVVTPPSPRRFWQRLPPFRRAFDATWRPVTLHWFACEAARWLPLALAGLSGLTLPELQITGDRQASVHSPDNVFVAKTLALALATLLAALFLVVPTGVVLVRVQASLLPAGDDAVVPFDRSFAGRVESALVGGRGFASMADAWHTFGRPAWRRLLVLYAKIFLASVAGFVLVTALILPEAILIASNSARLD
ncbi:hypothetical protein CDD83_8053 [Cordyceps sp. RAO-2017]|nr:hypothetical protein CDD83_8053 [Cordyceps sp. RAO-2017]